MGETNTKAKAGQYLTFQLMSEHYGIAITDVREINRMADITAIPRTPDEMRGVMNLRGKIIPVVDLRVKFGMHPQKATRDSCIVVIDSEIGPLGMIVDAVKEVVDLQENQIEAPPALGKDQALSFVRGLGKLDDKVVILVDILAAFSAEHLGLMKAA